MTTDTPPPDRNLIAAWTPLIVAVVVAAVVVIGIAVRRESGRDRKPADLDDAFVYDVDRYRAIPPEKIGYREVARIETGLARATALAVGPGDRIAVGGDKKVLVYSVEGALQTTIPTGESPLALATTPDGKLLVGTMNRVLACTFAEPLEEIFMIPGERAHITSIAADREFIYVADFGSRGVWRYTPGGELRGRIGDRDAGRDIPGFVVPSAYFDLAVAPDGLLRVVDPGRHQVDAFTAEGDLEISWGQASFELEGFSGCCNPSHIAILPDGRFVTSEKGIPRVKVYEADGAFATAVTGCDGLDTERDPCDVAADSRGRILVLDPGRGVVRIFKSLGRAGHDD